MPRRPKGGGDVDDGGAEVGQHEEGDEDEDEDGLFCSSNVYQLSLLTLSYVFGELSHFLVGVTSRDMAREIHYGDMACTLATVGLAKQNDEVGVANETCSGVKNESSCVALPYCEWNYTGLGLDYQVLAGPSFIAVFTLSGLVLGVLADQFSRTRLLGAAVILFAVATVGIGAATHYWQLVLFRMMLAAGESACSPLGVSLISDLFSPQVRGLATGIFHWGVYFGYGLSYVFGIYVTRADLFGKGWRGGYFLAGLPAFMLGLLVMMLPDQPPGSYSAGGGRRQRRRRTQTTAATKAAFSSNGSGSEEKVGLRLASHPEDEDEDEEEGWNEEKSVAARLRETATAFWQPAILLLFVAASIRHTAGFSFAYNARLYFLTYYPHCDVGSWISWISIVGGSVAVVMAGSISDRLVRKIGTKARVYMLGTAMLLSSPFALGVLLLPPPHAFACLLVYYLFAETWFALLFISLVEIVPSSVKTSILGLFLFMMNNLGGNLPVLVDPVSKAVGYREALYIFFPGSMAASGVMFLIASLAMKSKR